MSAAGKLRGTNHSDQEADVSNTMDEICDLTTAKIPHIAIHVFRETDDFAHVWERTCADRRMQSARTSFFEGGFPAAIRKYTQEQTPDLLIVETISTVDILEYEVDCLAEVCDPGTKLLIIGHTNDIKLYQKMLDMGASNYMVYPVTVASVIEAVSVIYREPGQEKIGKIHAVLGARGGVGASTIAHNVATEMAARSQSDVLLVDMDLVFGTASMNLDVEANQGLTELIDQAERIDTAMIDRVIVRHGLNLSILSTQPTLENPRIFTPTAVESILDVAQSHVPQIVLDIPHGWSDWVEKTLAMADTVSVVSSPELGSLRNAAKMIAQIGQLRPNDAEPVLVLNQVGVPRRLEIGEKEVASVIRHKPAVSIPFDARTFSQASSRGKMLNEVAKRCAATKGIRKITELLVPAKPIASRQARNQRRRVA